MSEIETPHTAGVRVIQPTGESITPKIDMDNLLANEEAKDILTQSTPDADFQSQMPAPEPAADTSIPEIQVNSNGVISMDNLPPAPVDPTGTFPQQ